MHKTRQRANTTAMKEKDLWQMFASTGDIEWYMMYKAMQEANEFERSKKE